MNRRPTQNSEANRLIPRFAALVVLAAVLVWQASPAVALVVGILFAFAIPHPFPHKNHTLTRRLLQICVVLLGFGMDLPVVLRLGWQGSFFAVTTIAATLGVGWWLGRRMSLGDRTTTLIASGTAICGGSAIAAVSSVIGATGAEIAVSIGVVFILNAAALTVFPFLGHVLGLSQEQFGLWAGVAIHDISSVVGAGISYGHEALATATAVKLSRTLWIAPLTLVMAFAAGRRLRDGTVSSAPKVKITIPWFIGFFLLASLVRSYVPVVPLWSPALLEIARRGMILTLFLIGTSLSLPAVKSVGWRTMVVGMILWMFISTLSLAIVLFAG